MAESGIVGFGHTVVRYIAEPFAVRERYGRHLTGKREDRLENELRRIAVQKWRMKIVAKIIIQRAPVTLVGPPGRDRVPLVGAHDPNSDADVGWRRMAEALGIAGDDLAVALEDPSPEARDLVDTVRLHGEQSGAAQAAGVAWVLERQLPTLMGALADALRDHYGVAEDALSYLRAEAARADEVQIWVAHLIDKYFMTADAYTVYEARRAMREAGWAWTALSEAG